MIRDIADADAPSVTKQGSDIKKKPKKKMKRQSGGNSGGSRRGARGAQAPPKSP